MHLLKVCIKCALSHDLTRGNVVPFLSTYLVVHYIFVNLYILSDIFTWRLGSLLNCISSLFAMNALSQLSTRYSKSVNMLHPEEVVDWLNGTTI